MAKHKHNYTQYSSKPKNTIDVALVDTIPEVTTKVMMTASHPDPVGHVGVAGVDGVTTVEGAVVDCAKLNVRAEPNVTADVVCVLNVQSEIEINIAKSTPEWFYVCTATGIEGYCMRKYIEAHL